MNAVKICKKLLELIITKYPSADIINVRLNDNEEAALKSIFDFTIACTQDDGFEEDEVLEYGDLFVFEEDNPDEYCDFDYESTCTQSSSQSSGQDWDDLQIEEEKEQFDFVYIKNAVECFNKYGWSRVQARFKRIKHRHYLYRFKEYLDKNGTKIEKLQKVNQHVKNLFENARQMFLPVHDEDLRRWAIQRAREITLDFQASSTWLLNFKIRNRIVSRKITKYLTLNEINQEEQIQKSADEFVTKIRNEMKNNGYEDTQIINTDQCGHEYEASSKRTLTNKGEKSTQIQVQSKHANTHSHTVQPMLTMSGEIVGKLLITLQERDGKFGPNVIKKLKIPENVYLTCSKSGKLDKKIVETWVVNCLKPAITSNVLLLCDSWGGQKDQNLYLEVENICQVQVIPPHTTGQIQPLDVYFFRQAKIFKKKMKDRILIDQLPISIHDRQIVINQHSLIHNQMKSPKFKKMIQYSWFKSGYTKNDPRPFYNVNQICFKQLGHDCEVGPVACSKAPFIRCSHCDIRLGLEHCLIEFHFHSLGA